MFSKRSSRGNEPVRRRRRIAEDDQSAGAPSPKQTQAGIKDRQFRRNQTLSSYRHNTPEESSRQKVHHLAVQRRKIGSLFLIVAIAVIALTLLLWQLMAQVHVVTSTKLLSSSFNPSVYENSINEYLGLNPAQRLRFALNEQALSAFVSSELPEVEGLSVSGSAGLAQSNFSITYRTPVAGWQINSKQYYVDASGVVFEKNYYETPVVQIIDESGVSPEQGSTIVGTRLLGFMGKVVAEAQGRGYTITKAVLPAGTTRQVDVYFDGIAPYVKYSIDRGAGEQTEDADRSLKFLQSHGTTAQYIDVRVPNRAAYR
ncbi:MAG: cell division protein FtsQ/DivIB [Candidatus Saccharimonadaceae bacterium]